MNLPRKILVTAALAALSFTASAQISSSRLLPAPGVEQSPALVLGFDHLLNVHFVHIARLFFSITSDKGNGGPFS